MKTMYSRRWALAGVVLIALAVAAYWTHGQRPSDSTPVGESVAQASAPENGHAAAPEWPCWGGALNSAENGGAGFFDRGKARNFTAWVGAAEKKYVVDLNARAFLPQPGREALDAIFGPAAAKRTAYLQFVEHPTPAQRARLAEQGVELLAYVAGYAWTASGTREAFAAALEQPFVRGSAAVDRRDKLHTLVFEQKIPPYAKTDNGAARLMLIGAPGTTAEGLQAALAGVAELARLPSRAAKPSILGPRLELAAGVQLAGKIAALDEVAYVGLVPPPMGQRDATIDLGSNISDVRDGPPNLTGAGVKVALRELGRMDAHDDFAARLVYVENDASTGVSNSAHATAVTGVIGSDGSTQPAAKGVAPGASLLAYSVTGDDAFTTSDVLDAITRGARISNHSYGPDGLSVWGDYQPESADWDGAIRGNGLIAVCAGNEESGGIFKHIDFFVGAKNTICVGAANDAARAEDLNDTPPVSRTDGLASYGEFGPMNDGRVKPDLVAFGGNGSGGGVMLDLGTNATQTNSGTSFSTPAVSGVTALVFQQYKAVFGAEPSGALAKALLCNSASDLGTPGPDAKYGFGIVNAEEAVATINSKQGAPASPFLEDVVSNAVTKTYLIDVQNVDELRMTLCWMDVAGSPGAAKALVNDLNLDLEAPDGSRVFPFSLDPDNPSNAATAGGANSVDPIEQVLVSKPLSGIWKVNVSGASIPAGEQGFALCCNRALLPTQLAAVISASPESGPAALSVLFSGAQSSGTITDYKWDFGDGTGDQGPDRGQVTHTYATAGAYTVTLTVNGAASVTKVIIVTKQVAQTIASKASLKLDFRGDENAPDDSFQFTLSSPELARPAAQAKQDLGQFTLLLYTIRAGGTRDTGVPTTKIASLNLDSRGNARSLNANFKLNLARGTMQVQFKKMALEAIFERVGMTRDPASSKVYEMPVEIETDSTIYRGVLRLDYKNKTGTNATAKSL